MAEKEEGAEAAPVARKKMSGKKLVLFIILPLLLLGGGAAAGYFLLFAHGDKDKQQAADQAPANESEDAVAVDEGKPPVLFVWTKPWTTFSALRACQSAKRGARTSAMLIARTLPGPSGA